MLDDARELNHRDRYRQYPTPNTVCDCDHRPPSNRILSPLSLDDRRRRRCASASVYLPGPTVAPSQTRRCSGSSLVVLRGAKLKERRIVLGQA